MKRKMNRLISLLLALTMTLSTLPLSVWAEGENTTESDNGTPPQQEQQDDLDDEGDGSDDDILDDESLEDEETPSTPPTGNETPDPSTPAVIDDGGEEAPTTVYTDGPWKFEVNSQGDAIIVGYDGTFENGNVNLRAKFEVSGTEYQVAMVGEGAFADRKDVVTVTVKEPLRRINAGAFSGCTALTTFSIPEGSELEYIGMNAFNGCTSLISVTIPEGIEEICAGAFANCNANLVITYEGTQSQWEELIGNTNIGVTESQVKCTGIEWEYAYDEETNGVTITGFNGTLGKSVEIPARLPYTVDGKTGDYRVKTINAGVFQGEKNIVTVDLHDTIEKIGENAFAGCTNLTTINYEGTKYRWNQVFKGDNAIPDNVNVIWAEDNYVDDWAYELEGKDGLIITSYKGNLTEVVIPEKLTVDSEKRTVVIIGTEAFKGKEITSVVIPDSVEELETGAFIGCSNLSKVTLSDNLRTIGRGAFRNCSSLSTIDLPSSVQRIREEAFLNSGLTMLSYEGGPSRLDNILNGDNDISDCWIVNRNSDVFSLAGYKGTLGGEVVLPTTYNGNSITHIASETFVGRDEITVLTIPEGYERINPGAFAECPFLTELYLPMSIKEIAGFAFADCESLEKVYYPGRQDQWDDLVYDENAFKGKDIDELLVFGDPGLYILSGTVKSSSGPIAGAVVTLTREDGTVETITTDANGAYRFENVSYQFDYTLTVEADGYGSKTNTIQVDQDTVFDVLLFSAAEYAANIDLAEQREDTEQTTFNAAIASETGDFKTLANLLDGLTEKKANGVITPALASNWVSDNNTQWTFYIKDNINWVDVNGNIITDENGNPIKVTAADFATALEWRLNSKKNPKGYSAIAMTEMIKGAAEYVEMTHEMANAAAWNLTAESDAFKNTVGISVNTDTAGITSITFNLTKPISYFPTVMAGSDFSGCHPMSQAMIDRLGKENINDMSHTQMWYCGAYLMADYAADSYKIYVPNPHYWDTTSRFEKVVVTKVDSYEEAYALFEAGRLDYVEIDGDVANRLINEGSEYANHLVSKVIRPYSYQMHWNFDKKDPDQQAVDSNGDPLYDRDGHAVYVEDTDWNTAIANEDFRKSLYYGWNLTNYYALTNPVNPLMAEHNTNTMVGMAYDSDGNDYTDLVKAELKELGVNLGAFDGENMARFNQTRAEEHKEAAMNTLLSQGVTFPVELDFYVKESNEETAAILRNCLAMSLGDDYVTVNVRTYEDRESLSKNVRDKKFQSLAINGWGMDYMDPYNNLVQFAVGDQDDDNDSLYYYSKHWNNSIDLDASHPVRILLENYSDQLTAADAMSGDARLEALAETEAYLIEHGLVTPCYIQVGYGLGYIKPESMVSNTMKGWELTDTLVDGEEIHDNGIIDMGVWKPKSKHDSVFDWILTKDGTLYITGNGSLEGTDGDNKGNDIPWSKSNKDLIKKILVSPGVTGIYETGAFEKLDKIAKVEWGEYTRAVPSAAAYSLRASNTMQIEKYSILETIGQSAFEGCTSLESIEIPTSVKTIGADAFADTGLTEIDYGGTSTDFAAIDGCDDFLFDTYQNLEGDHEFADQNNDNGINIADVDLLYRQAQANSTN